jgi:hypothetical protein
MKTIFIVCWHPKYRQEKNRHLSLPPAKSRKSTVLKPTFKSNFLTLFFTVVVATFFSLPAAVAQEEIEQQAVSQGEIENFKEVKKAARNQRVEANIEGK